MFQSSFNRVTYGVDTDQRGGEEAIAIIAERRRGPGAAAAQRVAPQVEAGANAAHAAICIFKFRKEH